MRLQRKYIEEEVALRGHLQQAIEAILDRLYLFEPCTKNRVGRAGVHMAVCAKLDLVHNNTLSSIIKKALEAKGATPSCSRGIQYYRGMRSRHD